MLRPEIYAQFVFTLPTFAFRFVYFHNQIEFFKLKSIQFLRWTFGIKSFSIKFIEIIFHSFVEALEASQFNTFILGVELFKTVEIFHPLGQFILQQVAGTVG